MLVIGVTGNIGSGKSTVCQILARLGAAVIDADKLGHETYRPHSQAWQELVAAFGKDIVKSDDEIDRKKLGQVVFSHPDALTRLNQIVHPKAHRLAQERIEAYRRQGAKAVALEATLLIEAKWTDLVDKIWLVVAPEDTVVQRLSLQEGKNEPQILARLKSQMTAEEKKKYADELICNNGSLSQLESRVTELWRKLSII
jgi:dephospho-CoA kinase